ncbi:MAG: hypothetical protein IPK21_05245 [Haliscomenobacter sp.]|nr:hypothetical protein [Haliscomenobacter sp.]
MGGDKCAAPSSEEMLRMFKTKLKVNNPLDCYTTADYKYSYAFFQDAVTTGTKLLGCNYSFDAKVVNTFPVCGSGKKVLVKLSYFDWCNPGEEHGLEECTYILLKWYDDKAPTFTDKRKVKEEDRIYQAQLPIWFYDGYSGIHAVYGRDGLHRCFVHRPSGLAGLPGLGS